MELFIKVDENNIPIGWPYEKSNLKVGFPELNFDSETPPDGWLKYIKVDKPELGPYQKFDESIGADISEAYPHNGLEWKLINGEIREVWHYITIAEVEKKTLQDKVKADWAALDPAGPASFIFNESTCQYEAPLPYPSDGKEYFWNEDFNSWQLTA